MKTGIHLLMLGLVVVVPACSSISDSIETQIALNYHTSEHFGNFPLDDVVGNYRASYFPAKSAGRRVEPSRGVALIYPSGILHEIESKSGFEIKANDVLLTLTDETGKRLRSVPVHFGEVLLIERNSEYPVVLSQRWVPSRKATRRDILRDLSDMMEEHQSRRKKAD
jgi:hypothetical protein